MIKITNEQKRMQANQLFNNGNIPGALSLLEEIIRNTPSDINSIYMSGICHAASGNYPAAEKYLSQAVKMKKGLFQAYDDLGLAQYYQNKFSSAIRSFNKAIKINPQHASAISHLALTYLQTNEASKALQYANKSVAIDKEKPQFINVQALCHRSLNQNKKATDIFKNIINDHPYFYDAVHNLYETCLKIDDFKNAEITLIEAKKLFKDNANLYITLGKLYESKNHITKAAQTYTEGVNNCGENPELLVSLGRANISLKEFETGFTLINRALSADNKYQPALTELCNFHILKKDYEMAYSVAKNFIEANPALPLMLGLSIAYANACRLNKSYEESISTLNKTIETPGIFDDTKSTALFLLADTYDKIKKYDGAFDTYNKANKVTSRESDIDYYKQTLAEIKNIINRDLLDNIAHSDNQSDKPVFIVGMPRSGTSLVEQIISSHADTYGAGEITELWRIGNDISGSMNLLNYTKKLSSLDKNHINEYANQYLTYIEKLSPDAVRITDKLPHNFMHIGLIETLFPNASIIHCQRHPFDTCLSIYFKKFNDNHVYARNLSELAQFYIEYTALMKHWQDTSSLNIFNLKYEDLVLNQEKLTHDIINHIGLDWDDECLRYYESKRAVMTPSYAQANRPIYTDSLNRWKNYKNHLQPLIDILGDPEQYC